MTKQNSKDAGKHQFSTFAMHAENPDDAATFDTLRDERAGFTGFSLTNENESNIAERAEVSSLDPETVARQYLKQSIASGSVPSLSITQSDDLKRDFRSLGTETLLLTNTKIVKFRETYNKIPIYGSLVTVELDDGNEFLAINSVIGEPSNVSAIAEVSPGKALKKALRLAGSEPSTEITPQLNYYLDDHTNSWRLVYIIENVPEIKERKNKKAFSGFQVVMDYVIDAHTGGLVDRLPRTPSMAALNEADAVDGLNVSRQIRFKLSPDGNAKILHDEQFNVLTYDFQFADPDLNPGHLPGTAVSNPPDPWAPEAVSAHANATAVAVFLREVLRRNNIDNQGGPLVSTVNCVVAKRNMLKENQWFNAFWTPAKRQMVYGQVLHGAELRSLAVNLDVVGHEMFHGVTNDTARLEYVNESGALNESYSDIFGIIISNFSQTDIADWNWQIGENLTAAEKPLRDLSRPSLHGQPEHMDHYDQSTDAAGNISVNKDVHNNSGIHNFAAYKIMTARHADLFLFKPAELAAIFYIGLTQYLTRRSNFSASRRAVILAAQTLFRSDPESARKIAAIADSFTAVGIPEPAG